MRRVREERAGAEARWVEEVCQKHACIYRMDDLLSDDLDPKLVTFYARLTVFFARKVLLS